MRIKNEYNFNYVIDSNEKYVICIASLKRSDIRLQRLIELAILAAHYNNGEYTKKYYNFLTRKKMFKGIARFKDGDTFNLEEAKEIARAKALRQANGIMEAFVKEIESELFATIRNISSIAIGTQLKKLEYIKKIKALTKQQ